MQNKAPQPNIDWFRVFHLIVLPLLLWVAIIMVVTQLLD